MRAEGLALLLLACLASAAMADPLGRLLTSPEERRLIAASLGGAGEEAGETQVVRFDGALEVELGRLAVWVNGRRFDRPEQLEGQGMVLVNREKEPLHLAVLGDDGLLHRLMPGQAFDRTTGRVLEAWQVEQASPGQTDREPGAEREQEASPATGKAVHVSRESATEAQFMLAGESGLSTTSGRRQ